MVTVQPCVCAAAAATRRHPCLPLACCSRLSAQQRHKFAIPAARPPLRQLRRGQAVAVAGAGCAAPAGAVRGAGACAVRGREMAHFACTPMACCLSQGGSQCPDPTSPRRQVPCPHAPAPAAEAGWGRRPPEQQLGGLCLVVQQTVHERRAAHHFHRVNLRPRLQQQLRHEEVAGLRGGREWRWAQEEGGLMARNRRRPLAQLLHAPPPSRVHEPHCLPPCYASPAEKGVASCQV